MSFQNAYTSTRVIETLESYSKSDIVNEVHLDKIDNKIHSHHIYSEKQFWWGVLNNIEKSWYDEFEFSNVTLSEHVARVPGLYFHPKASHFKKMANSQIEYVSSKWRHYTPQGKSQKILSGIGTLQIPPNIENWRIASISSNNNSSLGIPILIREEIWNHYKLKEGKVISNLKAKWEQMDTSWAKRFPSMRGIPKGYLIVNKAGQIEVEDKILPTVYHPFSIMEYEKKGSLFYDFVYVTVDSSELHFRDKIRAFLGEYRYFNNRYGTYLIEPFVNNPLLSDGDVIFHSPEELRKESTAANSHLKLIVERIKKETFNQHTIDGIKTFIDNHLDIEELKICSTDILINPNSWYTGERVYDELANLLEICIERNNIEELVDVLITYGL